MICLVVNKKKKKIGKKDTGKSNDQYIQLQLIPSSKKVRIRIRISIMVFVNEEKPTQFPIKL